MSTAPTKPGVVIQFADHVRPGAAVTEPTFAVGLELYEEVIAAIGRLAVDYPEMVRLVRPFVDALVGEDGAA